MLIGAIAALVATTVVCVVDTYLDESGLGAVASAVAAGGECKMRVRLYDSAVVEPITMHPFLLFHAYHPRFVLLLWQFI